MAYQGLLLAIPMAVVEEEGEEEGEVAQMSLAGCVSTMQSGRQTQTRGRGEAGTTTRTSMSSTLTAETQTQTETETETKRGQETCVLGVAV